MEHLLFPPLVAVEGKNIVVFTPNKQLNSNEGRGYFNQHRLGDATHDGRSKLLLQAGLETYRPALRLEVYELNQLIESMA